MHLTSKMFQKAKDSSQKDESNNYSFYDKNNDDDSEYQSRISRKNQMDLQLGKINWHCCRVIFFNFERYKPERCKSNSKSRKERALFDHYQ